MSVIPRSYLVKSLGALEQQCPHGVIPATGGVIVKISEVEALGFLCCHFSAGSVRAHAVAFLYCTHVAEQLLFATVSPQSTRRG